MTDIREDFMAVPSYIEDVSGSDGVLEPRAAVDSDAPRLSLNGNWRFRYRPAAALAPADFADLPADDPDWVDLPVPSHWQLHGFGSPIYADTLYPFPVEPPHVPTANPTGDYRRRVTVPSTWQGGRVVLRFDGVDSCFAVHVNGRAVGWSQGSRLPSEFDVTDAIGFGRENLVAVRVHQWSAGSYLEDQDTWRLSGIFRDVSLLLRPHGGLDDLRVTSDYDPTTGLGRLCVLGTEHATVSVPELGIQARSGETVQVPVSPWSAEQPRLYDCTVSRGGETARLRIGFRRVEIADGLLLVNGRRVLFRGVNRHDFHPDRGRVQTRDDMVDDIVLMKRHNINAVRTSHYPPHPDFLGLCDSYGLYVIDECDLETHGFSDLNWSRNPVDDPVWLDALIDRMRRTVARDRNHPSVVLWSLGNECGSGRNLEAMYRFTKELDPSRPVHYENDRPAARYSDVFSMMYASHAEVELIGRRAEPRRGNDWVHDAARRAAPFILCEYAHAMGTGPGGLAEYQRLFETYPRCQGGFVWEWIDQGLRITDALGRSYFGYGGDFGEEVHDGAFICDGLVYPDRTPSSGLIELKRVFAPIRFTYDATSWELTVHNLRDVAGVQDLAFRYAVERDGAVVADGSLDVPPVPAGSAVTILLPELPTPAGAVLTVRAELAEHTAWAPRGHEVAWAQWELAQPAPVDTSVRHPAVPAVAGGPGTVRLGEAEFDTVSGRLSRLGSIELRGPVLDLWRAPTDNDEGGVEPPAAAWRRAGLDRLRHRLLELRSGGPGQLVVSTRTAPGGIALGFVTTCTWQAGRTAGSVVVDVHIRPDGEWAFPLPRIGLAMDLPATFGRAAWLGLGPGESYPDLRTGVRFGSYDLAVDELQSDAVRPQENGHRSQVRRLVLGGTEEEPALEVLADRPFGFTARRWTSRDLDRAQHVVDLVPRDRVFVTIDLAVHGLGTGSCGPRELPEHTLRAEPRSARLVLRELTRR